MAYKFNPFTGTFDEKLEVSSITALTGGDLTIYDDVNNADVSLKIGTSATECLSIEVLNGTSNKTAEEIKISTATASGTANHGKISIHIDGVEILDIDDGGIDMASGKTVAINGTDLPTQLNGLSDWSSSNSSPIDDDTQANHYATLMPNVGDFHQDKDSGYLFIRKSTYIIGRFSYDNVDTYDFTPYVPDPECFGVAFVTTSGGNTGFSSEYLVGTNLNTSSGDSPTIFVRAQYNDDVVNGLDSGTAQITLTRQTSANNVDETYTVENLGSRSGQYEWTDGFTLDTDSNWVAGDSLKATFTPNSTSENGTALTATPSATAFKVKGLALIGICSANDETTVKAGMTAAYGTFNKGNTTDGNYINTNGFNINDSTVGGWRFPSSSANNIYTMKNAFNAKDVNITTTASRKYIFLAYNHTAELGSIYINGQDQIEGFNTSTTSWTNPAGVSSTYRYYVTIWDQDAGNVYEFTGVDV